MNSFKNAFEMGIKHANEASNNLAEISEVLDEFVDAIANFSDNRIKVVVWDRTEEIEQNVMSVLPAFFNKKYRHYKALMAINSGEPTVHTFELCEWKLSEKGYPVRIEYESKSPSCADKQSLVLCLSELISTPRVGKFFKRIMDHQE